MKCLRSVVINLSLVLLIVSVFPSLVLAHGDHGEDPATAETAADGDQEAMKKFVAHAKAHLDAAATGGINKVAEFRAETREEGDWKNGSTYLIQIERRGSVLNHGEHTEALYGDFINKFPTVESLMNKLRENDENVHCEEMNNNSHVCAAYYNSPFDTSGTRPPNIVIGGFDHEVDDMRIGKLVCDGYDHPLVTAKDLQRMQDDGISEDVLKENLKFLVKDAIRWVSMTPSPGEAQDLEPDIVSSVRCFTKESDRGPWKYGSIYFFVMTQESIVAVNGNNQELTGSQFTGVMDEAGNDIGKLIIDAAGENGKSGFVEYLWDHPTDGVDPIRKENMAPGNVPKISYVEGVTFPNFTGQTDTVFIFGSGIYPEMEEESSEMEEESSDDGCAIAGSENIAENTLFNLFLVVSGLFLAIFWRRNRSAGKA